MAASSSLRAGSPFFEASSGAYQATRWQGSWPDCSPPQLGQGDLRGQFPVDSRLAHLASSKLLQGPIKQAGGRVPGRTVLPLSRGRGISVGNSQWILALLILPGCQGLIFIESTCRQRRPTAGSPSWPFMVSRKTKSHFSRGKANECLQLKL